MAVAEARYVCCAVSVARRVVVGTAVVVSSLYGFRRQDVVQVFAVVVVRPVLDDLEHIVVDLAVRVANGWVVEHADDIVQDLVDGDVGVVPGVDDAGRDVLQDGDGDLASRCVQNV